MSVPSTAIAQVIQEIEVLCQHRRTNRTAAQGREQKHERPGYEATFLATLEQELRLPSLSVAIIVTILEIRSAFSRTAS